MSEKFQKKYRNESIRLQRWDYGWDAAYFITICTRDRENFFGNIVNGVMQVTQVGAIADVLWYEIKNHAKNVQLGEFVVMPNHIHGIIILYGNKPRGTTENYVLDGDDPVDPDHVGARHALPLRDGQPRQRKNHLQPPDPDPIPEKTIGWLFRSDRATDFGSNSATLKDHTMI